MVEDPCSTELKAMQSKLICTLFIWPKFLKGEQKVDVIGVQCTLTDE